SSSDSGAGIGGIGGAAPGAVPRFYTAPLTSRSPPRLGSLTGRERKPTDGGLERRVSLPKALDRPAELLDRGREGGRELGRRDGRATVVVLAQQLFVEQTRVLARLDPQLAAERRAARTVLLDRLGRPAALAVE